MLSPRLLDRFLIAPGERVKLDELPTTYKGFDELNELRKDVLREKADKLLQESIDELASAQELLWASDDHAVLVVLQAMDAAGKDGIIKHVMSGVNPRSCEVVSFKEPSEEEVDHTFLWRAAKRTPERGRIGIFNRSHYEDVLVVRVHPELLDRAKLPRGKRGRKFWEARFEDITAFERHLHRNGTLIRKFFLHVSKEEQKKRFLERLEDPEKLWKFSLGDLAERSYWDDYMKAYEEAIEATSTDWAPWYVVPADEKWASRAIVAHIVASTIRSLDLRYPKVSDEDRSRYEEARRTLLEE
jgi:PPK2 family polyphosphate:nucleotide phosphotransferase